MPDSALDIVVYGATGFTGALVAEYLVGVSEREGIRLGLAGRDLSKLGAVRDRIGASADTPLLKADSSDPTSLGELARQTSVVCSTVGPYQLYGDELVAACAKSGTDYLDLCGEPAWIARQIARHDAEARASGARLIFSCGFDSVPFDYGVYMLQKASIERFGVPAGKISCRVRDILGTASGGTIASGVATMKAVREDPAMLAILSDPFALTPGFKGAKQPDGSVVKRDDVTGSWVAPFVMAVVNTKTVHRTNYLLEHPWGSEFQYDEMVMVDGPNPPEGAGFDISGDTKPGDGPSREEREQGYYELLFIGQLDRARRIAVVVKGDMDPGYGSTAKMLGEAAISLVKDGGGSADRACGCVTPVYALGDDYADRLERFAGLSFTTEE